MNAIGAIDIGGTKIAVAMVDDGGRVLARREAPTQTAGDWPQACAAIAAMLRECAREADATVAGIGIGSTGPVNPLAGTFENLDTIPHWSGASPVTRKATLPTIRMTPSRSSRMSHFRRTLRQR